MTFENLLQAALYAVDHGWAIAPLWPKTKDPSVSPNGIYAATSDRDTIINVWAKNPNYNIGINLLKSNLAVLDVDTGLTESNWEQWCADHGIPRTLMVRSGRRPGFGLHAYFHAEGIDHTTKFTLPNGVAGEVRGGGVNLVAPGSIHESGCPYEIIVDAPIASPPDLVRNISGTKQPKPRPTRESGEKVPESQRHDYLLARAHELHSIGLEGKGLEDAVAFMYWKYCENDPRKDARIKRGEARDIAKWVESHPLQFPLQPGDFAAVSWAKKKFALFDEARKGNLQHFDGNVMKAVDYFYQALDSIGTKQEAIIRIFRASKLNELAVQGEQ
ncbi:MAG TPA: bifunctional DNA primase/polymerase [Verrucomicrobiae bacterium]|nr:bifunctional DNA primase/polymerase [Verrucomicrobiae bacterium]